MAHLMSLQGAGAEGCVQQCNSVANTPFWNPRCYTREAQRFDSNGRDGSSSHPGQALDGCQDVYAHMYMCVCVCVSVMAQRSGFKA